MVPEQPLQLSNISTVKHSTQVFTEWNEDDFKIVTIVYRVNTKFPENQSLSTTVELLGL